MPCGALPRGFTDAKLPWFDSINNNPCGKKALTSVNGVDVSAEALCQAHWAVKHGLQDLTGVIVTEP
jgi:hypothetical protein